MHCSPLQSFFVHSPKYQVILSDTSVYHSLPRFFQLTHPWQRFCNHYRKFQSKHLWVCEACMAITYCICEATIRPTHICWYYWQSSACLQAGCETLRLFCMNCHDLELQYDLVMLLCGALTGWKYADIHFAFFKFILQLGVELSKLVCMSFNIQEALGDSCSYPAPLNGSPSFPIIPSLKKRLTTTIIQFNVSLRDPRSHHLCWWLREGRSR